ncbi:hypothetical protein Calhy_2534 [Caldicellulosiruptor hydrothermalis 108]|uniref:Uncharacterized protein n=1 Tax=Caldicellulosiruptor hydrothermalis (strain DSM 18901 / VKM B-2411 / 108) TaxID=632292 RepID=E4QAC1_CALH1|nr:transglutaminase domain-containing protein [Caldicellulosiruptor hydrothermalis]ADQ08225.1 hypothetical protein Calhy_2534 [Caldicellulosiruptor hydrothermalis 108]
MKIKTKKVINIIVILALLTNLCISNTAVVYADTNSATAQISNVQVTTTKTAGRTVTYKINSINPDELSKVINDFNSKYGYLDVEDTIIIEFPGDYLFNLINDCLLYEFDITNYTSSMSQYSHEVLDKKYGAMKTSISSTSLYSFMRYKKSNGKYRYVYVDPRSPFNFYIEDKDFYKYFKVKEDSMFSSSDAKHIFYSKDFFSLNPIGQYFFNRLKIAPISGYSFIYQGKMYICGLEPAYNFFKEFLSKPAENIDDLPFEPIESAEGFKVIIANALYKTRICDTETSLELGNIWDGQIPYLIQTLKDIRQKAKEMTKGCKDLVDVGFRLERFFYTEVKYDYKWLEEGVSAVKAEKIKSDSEWNTEKGKKYAWAKSSIMKIWNYRYGICQDYARLAEVLGFYMGLNTLYADSNDLNHAWYVHDIYGLHWSSDTLGTTTDHILTPVTILTIGHQMDNKPVISEFLEWHTTRGFINLLKTNRSFAEKLFKKLVDNYRILSTYSPEVFLNDDYNYRIYDINGKWAPNSFTQDLWRREALFVLFPKYKEPPKKVTSIEQVFKDLDSRNMNDYEVRNYYILLQDLFKKEPKSLEEGRQVPIDILRKILNYVTVKTGKEYNSLKVNDDLELRYIDKLDSYVVLDPNILVCNKVYYTYISYVFPYVDLYFLVKPVYKKEGIAYGIYVGKLPKSGDLNSIDNKFIEDYIKNIPIYRANLAESDLAFKTFTVEDEPVVDKFDIVVREGDTFKINVSQKYGLPNTKFKFISVSKESMDKLLQGKISEASSQVSEIKYLGNSTFKALEPGIVKIIPVYEDEQLLLDLGKTLLMFSPDNKSNYSSSEWLNNHFAFRQDCGIIDILGNSYRTTWGFTNEEKIANSTWFYTIHPFDDEARRLFTTFPAMSIKVKVLPSPKAYFKTSKIIAKVGAVITLPIATTGSGAKYKIVVSNPNIVEIKNNNSVRIKSKGIVKLTIINSNGSKSECIVEVK